MKHLIIYSHPNPASFNHAIKETLVRVLKEKGQEVCVRDLYAMNFDPVLKGSELAGFMEGAVPEDIQIEQDHVRWADCVTFIFPVWWASLPAIGRGYMDRVFSQGFAYEGITGLLTEKQAFFINTLGAPLAVYEQTGMVKSMTQTIAETFCSFCGMKNLGYKFFGGVPAASEEERKNMLEEVAAIAAALPRLEK